MSATKWPPAEVPQAPNAIGIQLVLGSVFPEPSNGCVAVIDLSRPLCFVGESIVDSRHGEPVLNEPQRLFGALAAAILPAATVNEHHHGVGLCALLGSVKIQLEIARICLLKLQIAQRLDSRRNCWLGLFHPLLPEPMP